MSEENVTMKDLFEAITNLGKTREKEETKVVEKKKPDEEIQHVQKEIRETKEATDPEAQKRVDELERKLLELEADQKKRNDETEAEFNERLKKVKDRERGMIETTLESGLIARGFSSDSVKGIKEFISYDRLMDDEGIMSSDKVNELVNSISQIALRTPPKGGKKPTHSSKSAGFGKYLEDKN